MSILINRLFPVIDYRIVVDVVAVTDTSSVGMMVVGRLGVVVTTSTQAMKREQHHGVCVSVIKLQSCMT